MLFRKSQSSVNASQAKYGQLNSEFYDRSLKSWQQDNKIEMYLTHDAGKSALTERLGL